ncbi:Eco57I restriction-modification methylase domain-containing protein [Capnocytophaga sputigena]|uniref:Eco57I restriction-modification methylase domain-containing protein n=1 Tax=Capnocytophaga sputigena TaxID=1019 RepID=UPI0028EAFDC3|nr:N-6 DNA methylase [Capnocytophaga sputigena]
MTPSQKKNSKNKYGQYFTPKVVADFMVGLANISPNTKVLEPACGEGVFLSLLQEKGIKNITAFEIDTALAHSFHFVRHESFVSAHLTEKYDLIIGNPPYIRWKNLEEELKIELSQSSLWNKYCNSLCDYLYIFILKSIELLNEGGQLIFICPEYWLNTTHSLSLRNEMMNHGYFEELYHFNETPIFEGVTVSVIIFKYIKSKHRKNVIKVAKYHSKQKLTTEKLFNLQYQIPFENAEYIKVPQFDLNERWLLESKEVQAELRTLELACEKEFADLLFNEKTQYHTLGEYCDIGNGLVSGLDKAFQVNGHSLNKAEQSATIKVVKAKDITPFLAEVITRYIYIEEGLTEERFKELYPSYYLHFQPYKVNLQQRYQYNRKINYWEWVFLRNFHLFSKPESRIFVPCKERISNKNYFRFALVAQDIYPTQDVTAIFKKQHTQESIEYILAYLNQPIIFDWLKSNGVVKGSIVEFSEKPIASIPFRKIDWNNEKEVQQHHIITDVTKQYLKTKNSLQLTHIKTLFNQLLNI